MQGFSQGDDSESTDYEYHSVWERNIQAERTGELDMALGGVDLAKSPTSSFSLSPMLISPCRAAWA